MKKFMAMMVGIAFFFSTVSAPVVEANFWGERRGAARAKKMSDGGAYALVPSAGSFAGLSGAGEPPSVEDFPAARIPVARTFLTTQEIESLPGWLSGVPSVHGAITQAYIAPNAVDGPWVIHVQDVHEQTQVQSHISGLIQDIVNTGAVSLVGLEGAVGSFSLTPYRTFPDPSVVRDVADFLLQEHMMGGGEHAGWTAQKTPTLWGVEEMDVYLKNLRSFKEALPLQQRLQNRIKNWDFRLSKVKPTVFSPALKAFDNAQDRYQKNQLALSDFVDLMGQTVEIKDTSYPALRAFQKCLTMEKKLNFSQVEQERASLIEKLTEALSKKETEALVRRTLLYKSGQLNYGGYYQSLRSVCESKGVSLGRFPAMAAYIEYVLATERIKPETLLTELETLQQETAALLVKTAKERAIFDLSLDLNSLGRLAAFQMAPQDWRIYQKYRNRILDTAHRMDLLAPGTHVDGGDLSKEVVAFEGFCQAALTRDSMLVTRLLEKMQASGQKKALLLAGGFHTQGMTDLLRQKKVSYIVFTPTMGAVDADFHYLDFLKNRPALEKIFAQEKITTKSPIAGADTPVPGYESSRTAFCRLAKLLLTALSGGRKTLAVDQLSPVAVMPEGFGNYSMKSSRGEVCVSVGHGDTLPQQGGMTVRPVARFNGGGNGFLVYLREKKVSSLLSPLATIVQISHLFPTKKILVFFSGLVGVLLPLLRQIHENQKALIYAIQYYAPAIETTAVWIVYRFLSPWLGLADPVFDFFSHLILLYVLNMALGFGHRKGYVPENRQWSLAELTNRQRFFLGNRLFVSQISMVFGGVGFLFSILGHVLHNIAAPRFGWVAGSLLLTPV